MRFLFKEEYATQLAPIIIIPLIAFAMAIGMISFVNAIGWVGKPFPGFFYYKNLVVSFYQRSTWMGWDKGPRAYDLIKEVDGVKVKTANEFRDAFSSDKYKKSITYRVYRDGKTHSFILDVKRFSIGDFFFAFLLPFLLGMFFLLAGGLVYFAKSNKATLVNFFMCLLIALSYMTMFDSNTAYKFSQFWLIYPLFGAISAHLFLLFPEERDLVKRNRWIRYLPYIPALLLILLRYLNENNPSLSILFSKLSLLYMGGIFVLDLSLLIVTYANTKEGVIKQRAKIVAFGLVIASLIPVTWSALNALWRPIVGFDYAMGIAIVFPALVGYAATKRRFFDIDLVIKKSVSYGALSGALVILYLIIVTIISLLTQTLFRLDRSPIEPVISTLVIVVAFDPIRRHIQRLIDRFFYRDQYNLQQGFLELGREIGGEAFDIDEVGELLVKRFRELLRLNSAYLFLKEGVERFTLKYGKPEPNDLISIKLKSGKTASLLKGRTVEVEETISDLGINPAESEKLKSLGVRFLIPIHTKSGVLGIIALGDKLSNLPLSKDEIRLLEIVAHQTAISIENLWLYEEKSRDERLATLGQVASMIIHEIKNPLGIIRVSSGTLRKKFEKSDDREGEELATFIEEEVLRMDSTVRKFLSYVRPHEPSVEWVNINEVIRKALKALSPELESLKIETRLQSNLDEIEADADQLYQTILNLILNAKDATPLGGRLIIKTNERDGMCDVAIADTGKGIEKGVLESIFKPFYSGKKGGIGLGLTIAHQIVENHGGKIRVKSTKGRGTVFLITLPKRKKEAKERWKKSFLF
ncbi:MAG: ATP-binding protein [Candidatus Dadabacteria bacterium]|nr:ATP-binding protein [Candidatus Dadabacteria bacterium]